MSRVRLVANNTYRQAVMQKGFIAALLSVPLIVTATLGLVYFMVEMRQDRRPVGYVDNAAVLVQPLPPDQNGVSLIAFASTEAAHKALMADDIQAYYVVPADYRQTLQVEVVSKKGAGGAAAADFQDLVRANLLAGQPPDISQRILLGTDLIVRRPDGGREFADSASVGDVAPLFVFIFMAMAFMMVVGLNPGQPMLAVAQEKENRTMEIVVTSISPDALMAGKVIGSVAIAGTMVAGWVALIAAVAFAAVRILHISALQDLSLSPADVLFPLALYVPLYVMICALMVAVGATVVEPREGQQLSFVFMVPLMLPLYVLGLIIENPGSLVSVILGLFPVSAPVVLPLRVFLQPVPTWQIGLSVMLLVLSALSAIWFAGRTYRVGMLRYGQRLDWRAILSAAGRQRRAGGQP
jgi:ABC-2 type transport system permease protein